MSTWIKLALAFLFVAPITASAQLQLSKPHVTFWPQPVGRVSPVYELDVVNTGLNPVDIQMYGRCSSSFILAVPDCLENVSPQGVCRVRLRFRPLVAGLQTCTLYFKDSNGYLVDLPLAGEGI